MRRAVRLGVALTGMAAATGLWLKHRTALDRTNAGDLHGVAYVGSAACRRCHADRYQSWFRTFHRRMTADATPASVLGDFSGATLESDGVVARMDRDPAGGYRMTFTRAGAPPRVAEVVRTVGSRRYQQYLAREGDTTWRLPVAWHVEEQRWFPMTSAFLFASELPDGSAARPSPGAAGRPLFGGGAFDRHVTRWNDNCVFCHNVAPNPGLDPATGSFHTTVAELGVACEACHGPGGQHLARNLGSPPGGLFGRAGQADPTIVNPSRLSPARAADLCGRCHGQRLATEIEPLLEHGDPFLPGDDLAIESEPLWRDTSFRGDPRAFAPRFWSDGTARLTAYEYQGLLQSPCAMRGPLTCTSCHGMHEGDPRGQIRARFAGGSADRLCTGCHAALAAPAAAAAHSHHDPAGEGGRCVGCHMPRIVYGVLDVHRSHRIEIPDPARDADAGRPDACTGCHVDRTVAWAAAALGFWEGHPERPVPPTGTSPSEAIFAGDSVARAVAADALGRSPAPPGAAERARRVGILLDAMDADRYPAVRHLAWRSVLRLLAPGAGPPGGPGADYDPDAARATRAGAVARLRARLGPTGASPRSLAALATLKSAALAEDVEIGE